MPADAGEVDVRMPRAANCPVSTNLPAARPPVSPAVQLLAAGEAEARFGGVRESTCCALLSNGAAVHADDGAIDVAGDRKFHCLSGHGQDQCTGHCGRDELSFHWIESPKLIAIFQQVVFPTGVGEFSRNLP